MLSTMKLLEHKMRSGCQPRIRPLIFCRSNQYFTYYTRRPPLLICQQFLHTTNNKHVTLNISNSFIKYLTSNLKSGKLGPRPRHFYSTKTIETSLKKVSEIQSKARIGLMPGGEFGKVIRLAKPERWRITGKLYIFFNKIALT